MTPVVDEGRPDVTETRVPPNRPRLAPGDGLVLTPEQARSRRARNVAIGIVVALLVALVYVLTIVKLGSHVADRAI